MTDPSVTFGVVHGATVDAHFFETTMNYLTFQQKCEVDRLAGSLKEAAALISNKATAKKFRDEANRPIFQEAFAGVRSGPLLSMGRGQLCQTFLEHTNNDWLVKSDSDMTWEPSVPQQMVQLAESQGIKCLAGIVWIVWTNPDGTILRRVPNVYKAVHHKDGEYLHPIDASELPENALCRVGAVGAAFMVIHRELLEKIKAEQCNGQPFWWHHLPTPNGDQYGEDTSFSLRVRAAGEDVFVHTGPQFGHAKTIIEYGTNERNIGNG